MGAGFYGQTELSMTQAYKTLFLGGIMFTKGRILCRKVAVNYNNRNGASG